MRTDDLGGEKAASVESGPSSPYSTIYVHLPLSHVPSASVRKQQQEHVQRRQSNVYATERAFTHLSLATDMLFTPPNLRIQLNDQHENYLQYLWQTMKGSAMMAIN